MTALGSPQFSISSLKAETALSEFIHRAGHDIGNPLTSLISLASLIERSQSDPAMTLEDESLAKYSATIISDAWRVQGISEKVVLILSDRGSGAAPTPVVPISQNCIKKLLRKAAYRNGDILFVPASTALTAAIDPAQLEWLITELLINALNHTNQNPVTQTDGAPSDEMDSVTFAILDETLLPDKPGLVIIRIENDLRAPIDIELNSLFEPYMRFPAQGRGAGLGLTAAWAIVERAGGRISVEAVNGRFRTTVELPAQ